MTHPWNQDISTLSMVSRFQGSTVFSWVSHHAMHVLPCTCYMHRLHAHVRTQVNMNMHVTCTYMLVKIPTQCTMYMYVYWLTLLTGTCMYVCMNPKYSRSCWCVYASIVTCRGPVLSWALKHVVVTQEHARHYHTSQNTQAIMPNSWRDLTMSLIIRRMKSIQMVRAPLRKSYLSLLELLVCSSCECRYCRDIFERNYKTTIGVDFEVEKYKILGVPFHMQMWAIV